MVSVQHAFRQRLLLLADDSAILGALGEVSPGGSQHAEPTSWTRTYGRLLAATAPTTSPAKGDGAAVSGSDGEQAYALLVYERMHPRQEIRTIELYDTEPAHAGRTHRVDGLGWMADSRFPHDRRLPTLADSLHRAGDALVVRYRPGRRCTFRVDRAHDTFFCKVFPDDTGRRLHEEAQQLWSASARGELGFAVAEPVAWDPDTRTLWQRSLGGRSIGPALAERDAAVLARRLGYAAGTIGTASIAPTTRFDAAIQCDRSRKYARELRVRVPSLAALLEALIDTLQSVHVECGGRQRPIHGAPHMNQWLELDGGLGLVDFDRFSIGDPELDVATFLGELDFEDGLACSVDELATAFIAGYEHSAGPLDARLLAAYRAHKRLAKALRSARSLRPDGDARAERHCRRAVAALGHDDRGAVTRALPNHEVSA